MSTSDPVPGVEALFFDVFGTLVDWRTSIAREAEKVLGPLGHRLDWVAFADAWRAEYQPGMEAVRSGRIPFSKLDVLHRLNLERFIPRFGLTGLSDAVLDDLPFQAGDRVLLFTNSMGATPLLELYLAHGIAERLLAERDIAVSRRLVGPYVTSLEMLGISITLLRFDDEMIDLWDTPVRTVALRWGR